MRRTQASLGSPRALLPPPPPAQESVSPRPRESQASTDLCHPFFMFARWYPRFTSVLESTAYRLFFGKVAYLLMHGRRAGLPDSGRPKLEIVNFSKKIWVGV